MGKNNKKNKRKRSLSQESSASPGSGNKASSSIHNGGNKNEEEHHHQQKKKKQSNSPASKQQQPPKQKQQPQRKSVNNNNNNNKKNNNKSIQHINNPLYTKQQAFLNNPKLSTIERTEFFSPAISPERRAELWMEQADLGETLVNNYAWATPNDTAIQICKEFGPLIEIGCGANAYWCKVLKAHGVDIIGHDCNETAGGKIQDENEEKKKKNKNKNKNKPKKENVLEKLLTKDYSDRTLFLCYPDDEDDDDETEPAAFDNEGNPIPPPSMAAQCLEYYTGTYIIHVGEFFLDANYSMDQAPWGRSSSPEFQQRLASEFHCLLKVELPNWLHVRDSISVWKRSELTSIVFGGEGEEEDDDEDDEDDIDEVVYRHIPVEERLPMDLAAPCLAHLLPASSNGKKEAPLPASQKQKVSTKTPPAPSKQDEDDEDDDDDEDYDSDDANDEEEANDDGDDDDDSDSDDNDDDDDSDSDDSDDDEPMEPSPPPPKNKKPKKKGPLNLGVSQLVQKNIKKALKRGGGGKSASPW